MHDFLLAKEIIEALKKIAAEKKINQAKSVDIEVGNISMSHDGHPEHLEEINLENLKFGLNNIAKRTAFENADFRLKKIEGDSWKITNIEVE